MLEYSMGLFRKKLEDALTKLEKDTPDVLGAYDIIHDHYRDAVNSPNKTLVSLSKSLENYIRRIREADILLESASKRTEYRVEHNMPLFPVGEDQPIEGEVNNAKALIKAAQEDLRDVKSSLKKLLKKEIKLE